MVFISLQMSQTRSRSRTPVSDRAALCLNEKHVYYYTPKMRYTGAQVLEANGTTGLSREPRGSYAVADKPRVRKE